MFLGRGIRVWLRIEREDLSSVSDLFFEVF